VDAELEPSDPAPVSTCPKDCRLCIEACPMKALEAPGKLDPRRCIAFNNWMPIGSQEADTFGYIPRELRSLLGSRIHGCDACQEACPKNRKRLKATGWFGTAPALPADALLEQLADELTLEQLLHLPDGYYERCVQPVMYNYIRDLRLFQRNAAIAMGNSGDDRYIPHLAQELDSPHHLIRSHAAWALGAIGGAAARKHLGNR
jgi:epoxyqueuosine reductase